MGLKERKNCFKLYETASRYTTLCPYNSDSSSKETDEWETDFFTFKNKCGRSDSELSGKEKEELEKKINDKMERAKSQAIEEANEERREKKAIKETEEISGVVQKHKKIAMKAIEKEQSLEELIRQEAEEKNKNEEIRLRKQIENEKLKQKCVAKAIKEKELENEVQQKAKEIKEKVAEIKNEAVSQVIKKRNKLKQLINQINKQAELKRNKLRQQLQEVRMSTASDIGKAYKKGDVGRCIKANNNPKARNDYCIATFSESFADLNYCQQVHDFCDYCCQTEYGDLMESQKEECVKKVCPDKIKSD